MTEVSIIRNFAPPKFRKICPTRPEGAEALSPGQRPGLLRMIAYRPVREKALKFKKLTQPARPEGADALSKSLSEGGFIPAQKTAALLLA